MLPLWISREEALVAGMTHHGRMFGVPAWVAETGENEISGCPKIPVLQLWCQVIDWLMELVTYAMSEDMELVTPISLDRPIE
jgi:hypothetical protein